MRGYVVKENHERAIKEWDAATGKSPDTRQKKRV
jgi:hypothetical protein